MILCIHINISEYRYNIRFLIDHLLCFEGIDFSCRKLPRQRHGYSDLCVSFSRARKRLFVATFDPTRFLTPIHIFLSRCHKNKSKINNDESGGNNKRTKEGLKTPR